MYKLQPVMILSSALVGLFLGIFTPFGEVPIFLVELFLVLLLFIVFLSIDVQQLKKSFLNVKYTLTSILINFAFTPIVAYFLGIIFFEDSMAIRIGLMMLLVTPCTDWYLMFTKLSGGNVELNMYILPINLFLQVALLPLYLLLFFKSSVNIEFESILQSIGIVLLIPFICAMIAKKNLLKIPKAQTFLTERSDNLQLIFLCLAVLIMFASEGDNVVTNHMLFLKLFIPLICFFSITYFLVQIVGNYLKFSNKEKISLHFTTLARNSPLALAIAVTAFSAEPLIALSLIVGPLLELPILSIVSEVLKKKYY